MSLFSSLSYLLKRAALSINQTASKDQPSNIVHKGNRPSNKYSLNTESERSLNSTSYDAYLQYIISTRNFSADDERSIINDASTFHVENWKYFKNVSSFFLNISLGDVNTSISESEVHISNETYHNADFLLENWWNIFDERYLRHGWGWTTTLIIAYLLILVVGVIGNVMVILVVLLRSQMRTVTNMFIMNLAVADLFVIVFCVPSTLLANIFAPWILGSFMCKAVAYVQGVSICASAYSLAAISLDRCQAIYRNSERPRGFSQKICIGTVSIIWAAALSLTIPWAVVFEVKVSEYDGLRYCVEKWEVAKLGDIYFLLVNLFGFYTIPLLLIFVSNWVIYCHVTHRTVPQNSASSASVKKMHRHTRHVVLRMLGIVTLLFLFSWLPLYILVIIIKFSKSISEPEYNVLGIVVPIAQWLGNWNSCINPILYAFLNKKFRRMFISILPSWIPVKAAGQYVGSTRTPSVTTTAFTGRSLVRTRTDSRSDYHHSQQNERRNSTHQSNLLIGSKFEEPKGTVAITLVHIVSVTVPITTVLVSDSLENIYDAALEEKVVKEIITDL